MLTRNRRSRHELHVNADINLINLVDLAFVLLIIFMITAPMLQGGIEVQLPQAAAAPASSDEGVIVSIDRGGTIYLGRVPVRSMEDLERTFPSFMKQTGKREAYLRGDRGVPYGRVLQVLGALKRMNVAEVSLVVEPEPER
ncbi:MAG TPA: biopolymer transporter ExbD [Longimicrobiales bacterium]|nr:biopolymer transporter ExbD [Longimicrobiales bacterium]